MAAQGASGTDFYDRSILRPKHRAYYRSGRPVIKIGPKGALGSHEIRPIHSAPSLELSIVLWTVDLASPDKLWGGYNRYWTVTMRWRMRSSSVPWFPYHLTIRNRQNSRSFSALLFPPPLVAPYQKKVHNLSKKRRILVPNFIKIAWKLWPLDRNRHPTKE